MNPKFESPVAPFSVEAASEVETRAFAARLAAVLEAGDVLYLVGSLGAGKTTFTRGLVSGLNHPDSREVASPTFALHHRYEGGRLPVDHLDLYRLDGDAEVLGRQGLLDPILEREGVVIVEWAERLKPRPPGTLEVRFDIRGEDLRTLSLRALSLEGARRLEVLGAQNRGDRVR